MDVFAKLLGTIEVGDKIVASDAEFISRKIWCTFEMVEDMYPGIYDVYAIYGTRGKHKGQIIALSIRNDGYGFEFQRDYVISEIPVEDGIIGFVAPEIKALSEEIGKGEDNLLMEKGVMVKICEDHADSVPVSIDREIDGRIRGLLIDFLVNEEDGESYVPFYEVLDILEPHIEVNDLDLSEYTDDYGQDEEDPSEYEERLDFC